MSIFLKEEADLEHARAERHLTISRKLRKELKHLGNRNAEAVAERDMLRKKLNNLRNVGQRMANFCFNAAQPEFQLTEQDRPGLKRLQLDWDIAITKRAP